MTVRIATIGYVLFLGLIIYLADLGELERYVGFYQTIPAGDKAGHFFLMGFLALLANVTLNFRIFTFGGQRIFLGSAIVFGVVVLEEFSQLLFPARSFSLLDLCADGAGILFFSMLSLSLAKRRQLAAARSSVPVALKAPNQPRY